MNKLFITSILSVILIFSAHAQNSSISGNVRYFNLAATPMDDSTIVYLMQGTNVISQINTDNTGAYQFTNVTPGQYTIKSATIKKPGGWNGLDALLVLVSFSIQLPSYITGIKIAAMDVNGNELGNTADALAIVRLFTGQIPNFLPPNVSVPGNSSWISEKFTIQVAPNATYSQDIKMICTGDVNGSFLPY
jgi:hypothetical protein